jgi:predicted alpha/beta-hydrolase family hydrolase
MAPAPNAEPVHVDDALPACAPAMSPSSSISHRGPPPGADPRSVLERYRAVVDAVLSDTAINPPWVVIGGKSFGGRIASYRPP